MNRRRFLAVAAALVAGPLATRSVAASPLAARSITASSIAAARSLRVVAVGGTATECVYALGLGGALVGADTTSVFPDAALKLPRVGYQRSLSVEGLLSLTPDLVIAAHEAGPPTAVAQLKRAGVRWVGITGAHTPEAPAQKLEAVGAAFGQPAAAAARVAEYRAAWRDAAERIARMQGRPRAIFVMAHGGPTLNLAGRNTAAAAMLELAGVDNALDFDGYKTISAEALAAAAPDVIVTTHESIKGFGGIAALRGRPGLDTTPAARAGRVVALDGLLLLGFGPRLPQAVLALAQGSRGRVG